MFLVINQKILFSDFKLQERYQYFINKMSSTSATPPLTTWQMVKMLGPIILSEILLPILDNVTDLRMIIRLYWGIPGCKAHSSVLTQTAGYTECLRDPATFCEDRKDDYYCERNKHPRFASMLLGTILSFNAY